MATRSDHWFWGKSKAWQKAYLDSHPNSKYASAKKRGRSSVKIDKSIEPPHVAGWRKAKDARDAKVLERQKRDLKGMSGPELEMLKRSHDLRLPTHKMLSRERDINLHKVLKRK